MFFPFLLATFLTIFRKSSAVEQKLASIIQPVDKEQIQYTVYICIFSATVPANPPLSVLAPNRPAIIRFPPNFSTSIFFIPNQIEEYDWIILSSNRNVGEYGRRGLHPKPIWLRNKYRSTIKSHVKKGKESKWLQSSVESWNVFVIPIDPNPKREREKKKSQTKERDVEKTLMLGNRQEKEWRERKIKEEGEDDSITEVENKLKEKEGGRKAA